MENILITTDADDIHVMAIDWAINKLGGTCTKWYTADFPEKQKISINFRHGHPLHVDITGPDCSWESGKSSVVWFRRLPLSSLLTRMNQGDREIALRESESVIRGLIHSIAQNARWVNNPGAKLYGNNKIYQLTEALKVGFEIPNTYIGNNPSDIINFEKESKNIIYKTFLPTRWTDKKTDSHFYLYTARVCASDLQNDFALKTCPGIYQEYVDKSYEIRVTIMGDVVIAAQLLTQENKETMIDWRRTSVMKVHPYKLPLDIREKCLALMASLGFVFGCFDIIVTPDKRYIFLEVNEAGQFLWIEQLNPQIKLLDAFSRFLLFNNESRNINTNNDLSMRNFLLEVDCNTKLQEQQKKHSKSLPRNTTNEY